ncbi:MAG: hypothetical protein AMS24_05080 [Chlamydiae bacterium SM23_39]|nr:MAG: hypothetical protein AMS24_05080 [Chlamydiae bacterium SM23_39]
MKKYILITGAAGFIGSALIRYLNDLGYYDLFLVDTIDKEKAKNLNKKKFLELFSKKFIFPFLKKNIKNFNAIFHLGACSDTLEKNTKYLLENNFLYSIKLSKLAIENNVKFIYASSAATYGMGENKFNDDELENLKPLNNYGFSKYLFDLWIKKNNFLNKVVGLKYFNVFGPNEYHKKHMASMVFKMFDRVKNNKEVLLYKSFDPKYKDGEQKRDFIYIKDVVKLTFSFIDIFKKKYGIFNIGRGKATSWNFLAKSMFKALNKKERIRYIEMPKKLKKQYQNYTCANMEKINLIFPNYKFTPIEDAVYDYVNNYLLDKKIW